MEPLKLLLVSFREEWRSDLMKSLQNSGYVFEIMDVLNKKQALQACYQSKYDILLTSHYLPDGASGDLVQVLGSTIPCLVINDEINPKSDHLRTDQDLQIVEKSYLSMMQPKSWINTLKLVILKWEKSVVNKIAQGHINQRTLFDKVAARCAIELYNSSENRIENALKVILDIMEVSRIYVRNAPRQAKNSSVILHEISAPGEVPSSGLHRSVYEVPIYSKSGQLSFLGVEDTTNLRVWEKAETDLLKTIAALLEESKGGIRRKINMYSELGMTA